MLQGFFLGAGPCLLSCTPLFLPYLAGTSRSWQEGLRATIIFGLTRLVVYTCLGGVVGYTGYYLFQLFYSWWWGKIIWGMGGVFIILVGILLVSGEGIKNPFCKILQRQTLGNDTRGVIILGVLLGLSPCLPLLGILTEIMFLSEKFYQGFLYGLAFGLGTLFSPLLLLGIFTPLLAEKIRKVEKIGQVFNVVCGVLLIVVGIWVLVK